MKIKLLKDNMFHKAGHVYEHDNLGNLLNVGKDFNRKNVYIIYTKHPDFFQVIDEDEELIEEVVRHVFCKADYSGVGQAIKSAIKYLREKGKLK